MSFRQSAKRMGGIGVTLLVLVQALAQSASTPTCFTDEAQSAGITFVNASAKEQKYIVESMGGGTAMFDYDSDGRLDFYLVNSYSVEFAGRAAKSKS